jgi:hypothetical protein
LAAEGGWEKDKKDQPDDVALLPLAKRNHGKFYGKHSNAAAAAAAWDNRFSGPTDWREINGMVNKTKIVCVSHT